MTRIERMQVIQALAFKPAKPEPKPTKPELAKLISAKERGCSVAEGDYERHLVAGAIAEARRNRAKSVNH